MDNQRKFVTRVWAAIMHCEFVKGTPWVSADFYVPVLMGTCLVFVGFTISTTDSERGREWHMILCLEHINSRVLGKEKEGV